MSRRNIAFLTIYLVLVLLADLAWAQEHGNSPANISVKNFALPGAVGQFGIAEVLQVSPREHVLLCRKLESTNSNYPKTALATITLNGKGKVGTPHVIFKFTGKIRSVKAVWPGKSNDHGLVFMFYQPENLVDMIGVPAYLMVAKIDKVGKVIGSWKTLYEIQPEEFDYVSSGDIGVALSKDSVGVVLPWAYYRQSLWIWGIIKGQVIFLETDFNGNRLPETLSLKLPNNGHYISSNTYAPYYNGKLWVIPIICNIGKSVETNGQGAKYVVETIGRDVYLHTARRKKSKIFKTSSQRIEYVRNSNTTAGFGQMILLGAGNSGASNSAPAAKGVPIVLLMQKSISNPQPQNNLDTYNISYTLYDIDKRGKIHGRRRLEFDPINYSLPTNSDYNVLFVIDYIAPYETNTASINIAADLDSVYMFRLSGVLLNKGNSYKSEYHLQMLRADLTGGTTEVISSMTRKLAYAFYGLSWFGTLGKDICAITSTVRQIGSNFQVQNSILRNK